MQLHPVPWFWAIRPALCLLFGSLLVLFSGCGTFDSSRRAEIKPVAGQPDYHGYALLAELTGDEQDVSKLRFIKRERGELKALLQQIASTNRLAYEALQTFAKADPILNLKDNGLPPAEIAARKAISKYKEKAILSSKGKDLEVQLLLAQNEALTYGSHLASVTAATESNGDRRQFLEQLAVNLGKLQRKVVTMFASYYTVPEKS